MPALVDGATERLARGADGRAARVPRPAADGAVARGVGSETQRPFALVIVGGMLTTLLVALWVLPAIYSYITPRTWRRRRKRTSRSRTGRQPQEVRDASRAAAADRAVREHARMTTRGASIGHSCCRVPGRPRAGPRPGTPPAPDVVDLPVVLRLVRDVSPRLAVERQAVAGAEANRITARRLSESDLELRALPAERRAGDAVDGSRQSRPPSGCRCS